VDQIRLAHLTPQAVPTIENAARLLQLQFRIDLMCRAGAELLHAGLTEWRTQVSQRGDTGPWNNSIVTQLLAHCRAVLLPVRPSFEFAYDMFSY
jgi:hypothetical protein